MFATVVVLVACEVAVRPFAHRDYPRQILCYETVSESHWPAPGMEQTFAPQHYVDITEHLDAKLRAMAQYGTQVRPAPDARSLEAIEALARWRGSVVGVGAAEAFAVVREIC